MVATAERSVERSVDGGGVERVKVVMGITMACLGAVAAVVLTWLTSTPWDRPFWWVLVLLMVGWTSYALGTRGRV
jgi:hypothetical protein